MGSDALPTGVEITFLEFRSLMSPLANSSVEKERMNTGVVTASKTSIGGLRPSPFSDVS
eukprot:CAMPEP_0184323428 /NCGR_PEP_ID=MMETSP1049-20130417/130374_1 /TAXON_ID=77928 /ORGANISM="Proteomonas sulcata, Strain CCMP704" /LENGTH=58 /DNA_ID=CAMNT_0026644933 /DNA_START=264 /DNA_END=436 /DNA_ORIENTATION=+